MPARPHFAAALVLIASALAANAQTTPQIFPYATINGRELHLDFYPATAGNGPHPLIIWIHGGGWAAGSRAGTGPSLRFRADGYAVASIDYRLTSQAGQWGDAPVTWPAQAHDIKAAVRFLRANADNLDVDPCAFIAWGSSAGGHLAAILGTSTNHPFLEGSVGNHLAVSSAVQLAVDYYGPTELLLMNSDVTDPPGSQIDHDAVNSPESRLLGADLHGHSIADIRNNLNNPADPWPALRQLAHTAAPARLAIHAASNVPMFIAHGELDTSVPTNQSQRLADTLTNAGTTNTFVRVPDAGHGLPGSVADLVAGWLDQQLPALAPCGCAADLAPPTGALSFADIAAFLAAFNTQQPAADLALPVGELTFADITAFLAAFAAGCP